MASGFGRSLFGSLGALGLSVGDVLGFGISSMSTSGRAGAILGCGLTIFSKFVVAASAAPSTWFPAGVGSGIPRPRLIVGSPSRTNLSLSASIAVLGSMFLGVTPID